MASSDSAAAAALSDEQRSALVKASVEARRVDAAKQTKFCPSCGSRWLGGVMGDRSLVACVDCGHVTAKYLMKYEAVRVAA